MPTNLKCQHPRLAQLVERLTVEAKAQSSIGHWFDSGTSENGFFIALKCLFGAQECLNFEQQKHVESSPGPGQIEKARLPQPINCCGSAQAGGHMYFADDLFLSYREFMVCAAVDQSC